MVSHPHDLDLDAYCARVGYHGPRTATLATLRELHRLHPQAITFESLDPFAGQPVRLDAAALERKLVHGGRGGYCYEQNLLFSHVLRALGFTVSGLGARPLWNVPDEVMLPRTHMALRVALDGADYLVDVGFGGMTLTAPLELVPERVQATPHEPFRLIADGDDFVQQARVGDQWKAVYRFDLRPCYQADYEIASYYLSTHPDSSFVKTLIAARPTATGRMALRNRRLNLHAADGTSARRELADAAELRAVLERDFGLRLTPPLVAALDRVGE